MKQTILAIILAFSVTSYVHAAELSEDQIEEIAEQYIEACLSQNYAAWKSLFLDIGNVSESGFFYLTKDIKRIRIKEINGYNVHLQIHFKIKKREDGWLQLLPNGKIKYGAIIYLHPISVAFKNQHDLAARYSEGSDSSFHESAYTTPLLRSGIPVFGLKHKGPPHKQLKSLKQIKEWLTENGQNWDRFEPKLACPEDQFKALLKKYK